MGVNCDSILICVVGSLGDETSEKGGVREKGRI